MKLLSLLAAAVAVICGLASLPALTGRAFDLQLASLCGVGLALAAVTWLSPRISTFLRIFSLIFAVEFVLTALAFAASKSGWWPAYLKGLEIPLSLPITIAVFGLIVWTISYIPVIRQIMALADPYFESDAPRDVPLGFIGIRSLREKTLGTMLIIMLVVINQLQVAISVRLSFFNRDWFNAIQQKDAAAFWSLLIYVFCFWAAIFVISNLIEYFLQSSLQISWRRWLANRYSGLWLGRGGLYRMTLVGSGADNPDQRISEDVRGFVDSTYAYSVSLLSTISNLVSFSIILWTIPAEFAIPGTSIVVPGLPFWVALIFAVVATWITHLIGRPLIRLDFMRERFEADFRYSLARLREYGEQVALLRGEKSEKENLDNRFSAIVKNYFDIVFRQLKLTTFTQSFFQASAVVPYIIVAPYYFLDKITLGQMSQTAGAFGRVEGAMSFFIARYASLAAYKAVVDRLTTFGDAISKAAALGEGADGADGKPLARLESSPTGGADLRLKDLRLDLPDGREIVRTDSFVLQGGVSTLINGPSGSGKSTMFRAIAGIWPYGAGKIELPAKADGSPVHLMLLPQRPYVASGTLKRAASYPAVEDAYSDEEVRQALVHARLEKFADRLHDEDVWGQRLSGGEQQRLSIAHALLAKPDWLFLDEATSALDEKLEAEVYAMLEEQLPKTTIVSIGHRSALKAMHERRAELEPGQDGHFAPKYV